MLQNNMFLDSNFDWIFFVLTSKNEGKMSNFRTLIENANFAKIIVFFKENCYFPGSELPKIKRDAMLKRIEKQRRKKAWKIEFRSYFGPPKSLKIDPQSDIKRGLLRDATETM